MRQRVLRDGYMTRRLNDKSEFSVYSLCSVAFVSDSFFRTTYMVHHVLAASHFLFGNEVLQSYKKESNNKTCAKSFRKSISIINEILFTPIFHI